MKHSLLMLLTLALFSGAARAQDSTSGAIPGQLDLPNGVAARVNDVTITYTELENAVQTFVKGIMRVRQIPQEDLDREMPAIRIKVLRDMILDRLLLQACDAQNIDAPDELVSRWIQLQIDNQRKQGVSIKNPSDYLRLLQEEGNLTEEQVGEELRRKVRVNRLYWTKVFKDTYISPKDLRAHYLGNKSKFSTNPSYKFRHLLISGSNPDGRQIVEDIMKELKAGTAFEDLVKRYSEGPRREGGGYWELDQKGLEAWYPPIPRQVAVMVDDTVSPPMRSSIGVHFIKLEKRVDGEVLSFEKAQELIQTEIKKQRMQMQEQRYKEDLLRKARIETQKELRLDK